MLCKPAIQEREVRVDQLADPEVVVDEFGEKQFRLAEHRSREAVVELGVEPRVWAGGTQFVEPERLSGKVFREPLCARVVEHPINLPSQHPGV